MATGSASGDGVQPDVFHALPVAATLVDTAGVIVDVNDAFLQHASRLGVEVDPADRIGHPILDFARAPSSRVLLEGLLKTVLAGQPDSYEETPRFADDRARFMEVTGRPLIDDEGCVTGALILREDVTARVQRERRRQVLFDIHQTVWRMSNSDDLESVLVAVRDGLKDLDLPFED